MSYGRRYGAYWRLVAVTVAIIMGPATAAAAVGRYTCPETAALAARLSGQTAPEIASKPALRSPAGTVPHHPDDTTRQWRTRPCPSHLRFSDVIRPPT
jgi:hypothetical protein